jgi:plastocyanin
MGVAGVVVFAALTAAMGCDRIAPEQPQTLELNGDTVQLDPGVQLVEIELGLQDDGSDVAPGRASAHPGDIVRFTAGDGRMHAPAFDANRLAADVRAFLEQGSQLRGPPLVEEGTQWVVTLVGAPPGEYPFTCATHGAHGMIVVSPPEP